MSEPLQGHCLCGAVVVTVDGLLGDISGCHCDLCTRFGGGVQFGAGLSADRVSITGPVKVHRSSRLAERAWCDTCGSHVFFRYVEGADEGYMEVSPGLFADAGGARLTRIVYADQAIGGIEIAGDIQRVTKADYEARHPHLNKEV